MNRVVLGCLALALAGLGACGGDDGGSAATSVTAVVPLGGANPECPPPNLARIPPEAFSIGVAFDPALKVGGTTTWKITISNETGEATPLTFLSSQVAEILLKDGSGKVAYKWSTGRVFSQQVHCETYAAGESKTVDVAEDRPFALAAGAYTLEVFLAAAPNPPSYDAPVTVNA